MHRPVVHRDDLKHGERGFEEVIKTHDSVLHFRVVKDIIKRLLQPVLQERSADLSPSALVASARALTRTDALPLRQGPVSGVDRRLSNSALPRVLARELVEGDGAEHEEDEHQEGDHVREVGQRSHQCRHQLPHARHRVDGPQRAQDAERAQGSQVYLGRQELEHARQTTRKSMQFHASLKYAFLFKTNPSAIILNKASTVKVSVNTNPTTFSVWLNVVSESLSE